MEDLLEQPVTVEAVRSIADQLASLVGRGRTFGDLLAPFARGRSAYEIRPFDPDDPPLAFDTFFGWFYRSPEASACSDAASRLAFHRSQYQQPSGTRGPHYTYIVGLLEGAANGRVDYLNDVPIEDQDCACGACLRSRRVCFQFTNNAEEVLHGAACVPCWMNSMGSQCGFYRGMILAFFSSWSFLMPMFLVC